MAMTSEQKKQMVKRLNYLSKRWGNASFVKDQECIAIYWARLEELLSTLEFFGYKCKESGNITIENPGNPITYHTYSIEED